MRLVNRAMIFTKKIVKHIIRHISMEENGIVYRIYSSGSKLYKYKNALQLLDIESLSPKQKLIYDKYLKG
jgi:hypothetical protein